MKPLYSLFIITVLFTLSACNTVNEAFDPYDSPTGYKPVKDEKGHTKYVRKRVKSLDTYDNYLPEDDAHYSDDRYSNENESFRSENFKKMEQANNQLPSSPHQINRDYKPDAQPVLVKPKSANPTESDSSIRFGLFTSASSQAGVVHIGGTLDIPSDEIVEVSLGMSLFNSDKVYLGFDGVARFNMLKTHFSPYFGGGFYIGDSKKCRTYYDSSFDVIEECEKYFLITGFPELGFKYKTEEGQIFRFFYRGYSQIGQDIRDKASEIYGIAVTF